LCSGEGLGAEVVALLGPVVVLLGEHGSDQADDRVTSRSVPDDSARRLSEFRACR